MENKILVAGATGGVGKHIVKILKQSGEKFAILARNPKKALKLFGNEVKIHTADVKELDQLKLVMQGTNTVISAIGAKMPIGKNRPETIDYGGVKNLVDAAKASGVSKFILISSGSVTHPEHPLNKFGKILTWKFNGEEYLRNSGLKYAIIRPGGLKNEPGGQHQITLDQGDKISGMIAREDVATLAVISMKKSEEKNLTFEAIWSEKSPITNWESLFSDLNADE